MNAFLVPPRPPDLLLPQSSRARFPRDLLVDLRGVAPGGHIAWTWPCRRWRGADVVVALELPCEQWPPQSWRGYVSPEDVHRMRAVFDGRASEMEVTQCGEDLDVLLRRPRAGLAVSVWSPGT